MLEKDRVPAGGVNKEKKISQMAGINPEKVIIINFETSLEVGEKIIIEISWGSDH